MRTETPPNERRFFDEQFAAHSAEVMKGYLKDKLLRLAGKREIPNMDELNLYWTCMALDQRVLSQIPSQIMEQKNDEALKEYFLQREFPGKPLNEYNEMARENLPSVIEQYLKQDIKPVQVGDLGCGNAVFLQELKQIYGDDVDCYGVDPFVSQMPDNVNFNLGLAEILPENWDEKFDLMTCFESSMYFLDKERALQEALRALKQGGKLFYSAGSNNIPKSFNRTLFENLLSKEKGFESPEELRENYTYDMPDNFVLEKEYERKFKSWQAFYTKYYFPFLNYLDSIEKNNGHCVLKGREFKGERYDTPDRWCPETWHFKRIK